MAQVNFGRIGLIALAIGVGVAATLAIQSFRAPAPAPPMDHRSERQLVLHLTLSRFDDPIIVLGDSIVEASTLPRSVCGHPIVNAGLNRASTASELGEWLAAALAGKRAAAIVVALGINDALLLRPDEQAFRERYGALLDQLSKLTTRLAILSIASVETRQRVSEEMRREIMSTVDKYNAVLLDIAKRANAAFLPLSEMPTPHTIDGVHLNADGHMIWDRAVMQGAALACG
jgi:lysophospholipase L1-like esterase